MKTTLLYSMIISMCICNGAFGENNNTRSVTVSGEGSIEVVPDQAEIKCSIAIRNKSLDKAKNECDKRSLTVSEAIKAFSIAETNISESAFLITPIRGKGKLEYSMYEVKKSMIIMLTDLSNLKQLIDSLTQTGVNQIDRVSFSSSKEDEHENAAIILASEDAKKKATTLTSSLGAKLGPVKRIRESGTSTWDGDDWVCMGDDPFAAGSFGSSPKKDFHIGTISINYEIEVEFSID